MSSLPGSTGARGGLASSSRRRVVVFGQDDAFKQCLGRKSVLRQAERYVQIASALLVALNMYYLADVHHVTDCERPGYGTVSHVCVVSSAISPF